VAIICKGEVLLDTPNKDNYSESSILSMMAVERKLRIRGNEYAPYTIPNDAIVDIL
jgi:hypothetical protein